MKEHPLVSVIIPVYNREGFITRCIDSVLSQSYRNIEIIVVYDPSKDKTLKFLEKYGTDINLIINKKKTSPAIARNIGIMKAKGEYIAFCDSDDWWEMDKIEKQIEMLKSSEAGLCYTQSLLHKGNEVMDGLAREHNPKILRWRNYVPFSSVVVKKEFLQHLIKKDGYVFDPTLNASDDYDFLLRLNTISQMIYLNVIKTHIEIHDGNLTTHDGKLKMKPHIKAFKQVFIMYMKHQMYPQILWALLAPPLARIKKIFFPKPWI